jgi:hypothetical protein
MLPRFTHVWYFTLNTFWRYQLDSVARRCALLIALAGAGFLARGQPALPKKVNCIAPQQPQTLVLNFVAANDVTVPATKAGPHWVISPLPTGDDIRVSDPDLKSAIQNWVNEQNSSKVRHPWVMDGRNKWTFFTSGLSRGLAADFTINPYPVVSPPATMPQPSVKIPVTFCTEHFPALHLDTLQIQVVSAEYDPTKPKPAQPLNAKLDPGVMASALLSDEDFNLGSDVALNAFAKVAEAAWQTARQNGIAVGSDAKNDVLRKAETSITAIYNMAQNNIPYQFWGQWPEAWAIFQHTPDGRCCTLTIGNVQIAKGATIRVEANLPDSGPASKEGKGSQKPDGITEHPAQIPQPGNTKPQDARQKRAVKLAQRSQEALARRFESSLAAFKNTVPTFAQIDSLRSNLAAAHEIYPTVRLGILDADIPAEKNRNIVFDTDNRWTILSVKLSAGGGHSVEDKGTGKVDFQGENLIFQILDLLNPKETESLSYMGGGEVQKANANWGLTWAHNYAGGAQATFGPQVSGDFAQDQNQRLGNVTGPLLRDHEIGWEPSFVCAYASSPLNGLGPASHLFGLNAGAGIRERWVRISPATGNSFPLRASGLLAAFFLDVTPGYHYQPVKPVHLGGIDVTAAAHFLQGLAAGDYTFTQILMSAQATLYFGGSDPRDFFVRFRKGMGTSNGATPLFELFRLGGSDNTRGVEQGEQVGREIAFEQSEAGISARQIVSWFQRAPSDAQQTPKASPIDLSKIYLKGFYDRGRVTGTGSFADLFAFNHGAKGYGVAVELQTLSAGNKRITLSLGYARSPDSALHRRGVLITGATLDF